MLQKKKIAFQKSRKKNMTSRYIYFSNTYVVIQIEIIEVYYKIKSVNIIFGREIHNGFT